MSVSGLIAKVLSAPAGLGTKIVGGLGLAGVGAGLATPLAIGYSGDRNGSGVAALISDSHGSIKRELQKSKRFLGNMSSEQAKEIGQRLQEAKQLVEASRNERLNWQNNLSSRETDFEEMKILFKNMRRKFGKLEKKLPSAETK